MGFKPPNIPNIVTERGPSQSPAHLTREHKSFSHNKKRRDVSSLFFRNRCLKSDFVSGSSRFTFNKHYSENFKQNKNKALYLHIIFIK